MLVFGVVVFVVVNGFGVVVVQLVCFVANCCECKESIGLVENRELGATSAVMIYVV